MIGRIHSIETMGLVDGPGIRTVVFLQGCSLRCQYCHNPDTWAFNGGTEYTPEELVAFIKRFKPYFDKSGGGVTFSGGEPLLQAGFLAEVLKLCKEQKIHTCIDTAGYGLGKYDEILQYTDLVLYDVKHFLADKYREITGQDITKSLCFLEALKQSQTKIWIRHVAVPGLTDRYEHLAYLKDYIKTIPMVEKVEILPYHLLGVNKYEKMESPYPLEGVEAMDPGIIDQYQSQLFAE